MKNWALVRASVAVALIAFCLLVDLTGGRRAVARLNLPAQPPEVTVEFVAFEEPRGDCIPPEARAQVERRIAEYEARVKRASGATKLSPTTSPQAYPFHPQAGTLWQDLFLNNFVDLDAGGGVLDWDCTSITYDGHHGHDANIRSFKEQAIGVPVFAALDGVVAAAHDGEPDMNTQALGQAANYVVIDHGGSHFTWYYHLKNGSVAVVVGQTVVAGTQLGLTASSGNSTHPHLHFESRFNNTWYEPSAGQCRTGSSGWVNQTPIRRELYARDFGFSTTAFSGNPAFESNQRTGAFTLGQATRYFRADFSFLPVNPPYRVRVFRPDNSVATDFSGTLNLPSGARGGALYFSFGTNLNVTGTWRLLMEVNNQALADAPFAVVATPAEIVNRAPNAVTASFDPAAPSHDTATFCRVNTSLILDDPDYDTVRYRYEWRVNGAVVRDVTSAALSDALPKGAAQSGNILSCTVTPSDGAANGQPAIVTTTIGGETPAGLQFYPLPSPVRLLDTRFGASPNACSQPNQPIAGSTSRTQSARGFCGLPANAQAITGNVTTVQSGGGYLTLYPSGAQQSTVASTNYGANEVVNNVFTVGLGNADGAFNIFALTTTDVVVDVTGYYAPPANGGLYFHPLPAPVRLLETRAGQAVGCVKPGVPLAGGQDSPQTATITCTGIPAAARAIVGNATTVSPQGAGYLTLFPADATRPLVASSNYNAGQIVNGPFSVGLSATGQFKIFTLATTELVVDVLGYFSPEATDTNGAGLLFTPLPRPVRLLETRAGQSVGCFKPNAPVNGGQIHTQAAQGLCDGLTIPASALGVVGNATVVTPLGGGYLTLWPSNVAQPTVATANYQGGQIINRHFIVGLGNADGAFNMFSPATTELVIDLSGYFAP